MLTNPYLVLLTAAITVRGHATAVVEPGPGRR